MKTIVSVSALWLLASLAAHCAPAPSSSATATAATNLAPSLLVVEFQLQKNKGETPRGAGLLERCPSCGKFHVDQAAEMLQEERPLALAGYLLADGKVVLEDPLIHPRFIQSIRVRLGSASVSARLSAYARHKLALMLELSAPLPGARPLQFDTRGEEPFLLDHFLSGNGEWLQSITPLANAIAVRANSVAIVSSPAPGLILDSRGVPVGLQFDAELPLDGSWKGTPLDWIWAPMDTVQDHLRELEKSTSQTLLKVTLGFRSPKQRPEQQMRYAPMGAEDDNSTEQNALGVVVKPDQVVVLASLKSKTTARLEKITVHPANGSPVEARFHASLKHFGCFLAKLESPLPRVIGDSGRNIVTYRDERIFFVDLNVQGGKRVGFYQPGGISFYKLRAQGRPYPELVGDYARTFLFDWSGNLLAMPLKERQTLSTEEFHEAANEAISTPFRYVLDSLAQLSDCSDPANVPLTEAEDSRLAWLGVELQPLNKDLARVNKVSDETRDGETGALVTYVYEGSPAAKTGLEPGNILLRVRSRAQPSAIDIKIEDDRQRLQDFPWDRLDEVPEQFLDRIPSPWPSPENNFTRLLTGLGFGNEFNLEFVKNSQLTNCNFKVEASPAHFDAAERYKAENLGVTVKNLTYEVRRYLQRGSEEPGVVISKVEQGSKAAVAGIKPFELITHVNDQPLASVKEFQKLATQPGVLRLSIKRMDKGRIVKLTGGQ